MLARHGAGKEERRDVHAGEQQEEAQHHEEGQRDPILIASQALAKRRRELANR